MKLRTACMVVAISALVCLAIARTSTGAPSISSTSGTFTHDNSVTISGSGFGTKATAAPLKWETFEDGVAGTNVTTTNYWSVQSSTEDNVLFDDGTYNSTRHGESDMHVRWIRDTDLGGTYCFYRENVGFASTGGKAYVNTWVYIDYGYGDDDGWQLKLMYLHKDNAHGSKPMFSVKTWTYDNETTGSVQIHYCDDAAYGYSAYLMNGDASMMPEGYWVNLVMEYEDSSAPDEDDGFARLYHSDALGSDPYCVRTKSDITTRCESEGATGYVDCVSLGYLTQNGCDEATTYWDDVYMDNSWARVEIGDASTYANCTHREMQIPTAWSTSSISIDVNQGSMSTGTAYLYVVDDDGAVNSSGYQITISSGGGTSYTLTVNTGSGSGTYSENDVANISANTAPSGQEFDEWTGDTSGIASVTSSSTTLTMPASDQEVTATYTDKTWTLMVNSGSGDGSYVVATVVNIAADSAPSGQEFDQWTGDVDTIADVYDGTTTITMPYADAEITATYDTFCTKHFREGGGTGYDDETFDDCYVASGDSNVKNGNYAAATNTCTGLIAVKDLFTEVPASSGGYGIEVRSAKLHLTNYQSTSGADTAEVYRCTTNWLTEAAGSSEADTNVYYSDISSETRWASGDFSSSDYDTSVCCTATWPTVWDTSVAIDVTELVEDIYDSEVNYGFVVETLADHWIYWWCSEQAATYRRPSLELKYHYAIPHYTLTVNSGSGDGSYAESAVVNISADAAVSGYEFDEWTGDTSGIADIYDDTTTITIPASNAEITATYAGDTIVFKIDFDDQTTPAGSDWYVLDSTGTTPVTLTDTTESDLGGTGGNGVTLTLSSGWWNGTATEQEGAFSTTCPDLADGAEDFYYFGNATRTITLKFYGTSANKDWDVDIVSSRDSAGPVVADHKVEDSYSDNSNSDDFDAADDGYDSGELMTWESVSPDGSDEITIEVTALGTNYAYVNAVRLTEAP